MSVAWVTFAILVNGAWERLQSAPVDLDDRIALGRVETKMVSDRGRMVMQWRSLK